jgi:hypothetical protein
MVSLVLANFCISLDNIVDVQKAAPDFGTFEYFSGLLFFSSICKLGYQYFQDQKNH